MNIMHQVLWINYIIGGIFTCNAAETSFNMLKEYCRIQKHPLLIVSQTLIQISNKWMKNSIENECVNIPQILERIVPSNTRKCAIEYITNEIKESVTINGNIKCNYMQCIYKLPCIHFK